ncbi:hypothetical protein [Polaribacter sp. R77954]|uniref:hypothetical protein n=1 Tax=Polaribacter sp. R77954 TaxID=3093870 RepID=UPI0037C7FF3D
MKNISFLVLLLLFNCKIHKEIKKNEPAQNKDWTVHSEKDFTTLNTVDIKILNNTKHNLMIFDPFLKKIEKFDGENWTKIDVPYCPCGGCPPPPAVLSISANQQHIFNWDKNITNCKNGRKTTQRMQSGSYRVIFNYGTSENVKSYQQLVVEFKI